MSKKSRKRKEMQSSDRPYDALSKKKQTMSKTYLEYLETRKELKREHKPVCLMDLATVAVKYLKTNGMLSKLDEPCTQTYAGNGTIRFNYIFSNGLHCTRNQRKEP